MVTVAPIVRAESSAEERERAAVEIQRHYRGHRERRHLKGHQLTPTQRWNEKRITVKSRVQFPAMLGLPRNSSRLRRTAGDQGEVRNGGFRNRRRNGIKQYYLQSRRNMTMSYPRIAIVIMEMRRTAKLERREERKGGKKGCRSEGSELSTQKLWICSISLKWLT
ncbi:hypothetical protein P167DRAFT_335340 [Morchella conica CCBAS932]|uniref:Uncharacterized protein n=1 Tax=Morchella conica CCBAS932 TaxID=1392247 RepID=A0A3N4KJY8_9PEZI|nr:hypothetical protein P167DRAFT_335340 [Morchella conica CCBAS932]